MPRVVEIHWEVLGVVRCCSIFDGLAARLLDIVEDCRVLLGIAGTLLELELLRGAGKWWGG